MCCICSGRIQLLLEAMYHAILQNVCLCDLFITCSAKPALSLQYKAQLDELRTTAQEDMEVAKRKDGLDWVNIDPAQLKPKFA